MRRFVLLDRDGTLNAFVHHLREVDQMALLPQTGEALRRLQAAGLGLAVVTNQSVVGRGLLSPAGLDRIHDRMVRLLAAEQVVLDGLFVCPHLPDAGCGCRKPAPGLVEQAAQQLRFDPRTSFVVGDNDSDIQLGRRIGATTLLVKTGHGAALVKQGRVQADYVEEDLAAAAERIVGLV